MAETKEKYKREYSTRTFTGEELIEHMMNCLTVQQKMDVQRVQSEDGNTIIVQGRIKNGAYKQFLGLDRAATLRFQIKPNTVAVEVGEGKWLDKVVLTTIPVFVAFWWLIIPTAYGTAKQHQLFQLIMREMDSFMYGIPYDKRTFGEKMVDFSQTSAGYKIANKASETISKFLR